MTKVGSYDVSRRDVMKAIGGTVVVGGVTSATVGTAAAQFAILCPLGDCGTVVKSDEPSHFPEGVTVTPITNGSRYTFDLSIWADHEVTFTIKGGNECFPDQTVHLCGEGSTSVDVTKGDPQAYSHSYACINPRPCEDAPPADNPNFGRGCSQVCGITNPANVRVVYNENNQFGEPECKPVPNPENYVANGVLSGPGTRGEETNCYSVSDDYKIIGVGDTRNTNRCADVCYR